MADSIFAVAIDGPAKYLAVGRHIELVLGIVSGVGGEDDDEDDDEEEEDEDVEEEESEKEEEEEGMEGKDGPTRSLKEKEGEKERGEMMSLR